MARQQVRLGYIDQDTSAATTKDVTCRLVKGWYQFDAMRRFPAILHEHLTGGLSEQNKGANRRITLDFGVQQDYATQKALFYWYNDPDRTINLIIAAPTGLAVGAAASGGSLAASTTYYYRVSTVDEVGETTGATQASGTTGISPNLTLPLSWNAATNARSYRIYRTLVSAD